MFLKDITLIIPETADDKRKLMRFLPDKKIYDASNALVVKHNEDYYLLKVRPSHERCLTTDNFTVVKKNAFIDYKFVNMFMRSMVGACIVFDITGFKYP